MKQVSCLAAAIAVPLLAACNVEISLDGAADADLIAAAGDEYLEFVAARDPYLKFRRGEKVEDFPDWTLEAAEADAAFARNLLDRLAGVDEEAVDHEDWISLRLLRWNLGMLVEAPKHYWADFNITPYAAGGFSLNILHQVLGATPVETDEDRALYLHLLDEYAQGIGQLADKVSGQKERGIYLPKAQVPAVVGMFEGYRGRLEELFVPAADRAGDGADDFLDQVREAVETGIDARFSRLIAELGDDYLEAAPDQVGLSEVPGGRELYVHRVRMHTTTDLTPEEIHQFGLEQVAQIEAELAALREEIGFEATSEDTAMQEFLDQVRADPRFIAGVARGGRGALHGLHREDRASHRRLLRRAPGGALRRPPPRPDGRGDDDLRRLPATDLRQPARRVPLQRFPTSRIAHCSRPRG